MSNTKHTPGPWQVGASIWGVNDSNTSLAVWPEPHGRNPICLISPIQEVKEHDQANAKLIAAAPELLEACKEVVKGYEGDGMENMEARDKVFYKVCKEAIKKATE